MAQLNPNFEIDFSDINSYEQIQLINDAHLARENLLMHRAYREPSDDEVIRNNYSSYTFIDFRPRIFAAKNVQKFSATRGLISSPSNDNCDLLLMGSSPCSATSGPHCDLSNNKQQQPTYELEKFSDIFERINIWLKLNKEWQAVSVETLFYDSTTQFNHVRSSAYSNHLPKNTRAIRLHLCPFKSRFSGPQKIGCINVVPRRLRRSEDKSENQDKRSDPNPTTISSSDYENLDQILARLNELLVSKPVEGRILSVETIPMPIINGRVDYECNYITDSRLNLLEQFTNCSVDPQPPAGYRGDMGGHCLVDILRVYYEFGPTPCGLVNLIDFVPRFYSPTEVRDEFGADILAQNDDLNEEDEENIEENENDNSCAKNENDADDNNANQDASQDKPLIDDSSGNRNLDDLQSIATVRKSFATESLTRLIRRSLAWFEDESRRVFDATPANLIGEIDTKLAAMAFDDEHDADREDPFGDRGSNEGSASISDNNQLKLRLCNMQVHHKTFLKGELYKITPSNILDVFQTRTMIHQLKAPLIGAYSQLKTSGSPLVRTELCQPYDVKFVRLAYVMPIYNQCQSLPASPSCSSSVLGQSPSFNNNGLFPLCPVIETNERHLRDELAHQAGLGEADKKLNESPIGQLTYRLFAPCQLVNSSSCFAINPVNSSSPLARRGSVDLNGSGLSSDSAHPSALFPSPAGGAASSPTTTPTTTATPTTLTTSGTIYGQQVTTIAEQQKQAAFSENDGGCMISLSGSSPGSSQLAPNEFEPVEAIRKRMEIYVTTNSMKVLAGETLIVNLSSNFSCLSNAIEQTVVRASFARTRPSTWVSVYILYAAVDDQLMPSQLLAQQDKSAPAPTSAPIVRPSARLPASSPALTSSESQ